MFGITWGIISITLMVAATEGLRVGLKRNTETFGKDIMIFFAGRTSLQAGGMRAGRESPLRRRRLSGDRSQSPACRFVLPEIGNQVQLRSRYNSGNLLTVGSLPPFSGVRSIDVGEGRFYDDDGRGERESCSVSRQRRKKQLFGSRTAIGETCGLATFPYVVIGVMRPKDQNSDYDGQDIRKIFIPYSAIVRDFPNQPPAPPHTIDSFAGSAKIARAA